MSWLFGNTLSADNQDSPIGYAGEKFQRWTDPLSWITGGKWADLTSKTIPNATNRILEPIAKPVNEFDQTVNPLRKIPMVNNVANLGYAKPGDSIGLAIGSVFTGGALGGALGAGEGGGAGAGTGAAAGAGAGAGASGGGLSSLFGLGGGLGADVGGGAGAGGLTGFFSGPAAFGDAGLTGTVSAGGSGLGSALGGDLGGSLGASPTGLFSGLLPGGGMTGTASGALGGGISGETAGASGIGGASMGGLGGGIDWTNLAQQALKQQSQVNQQNANQAYGRQQQSGSYADPQAILLSPKVASPTTNSQLLGQLLMNRTAASWGGA
ncbi:hypothetical protein [Paraburkholderia fynbosensis]|uniref:Uncharacterized protein n=1 Tax=Paraburkholderia fynbosensis TaxID=1200993 RepID=A0A6J5FPR8_9BURK|nr:hypothetical protein [Paraburkholderia fynbosensis]CAB3782044.1 hypothetical protein LMG27177_01152 [Paraburkholderia fynbosensis]